MKHFISAVIGMLFLANCKKTEPSSPYSNNEFIAKIVFFTGNEVNFNIKGTKAWMSRRSTFGPPGFAQGTNESNQWVVVELYPEIITTGTFNFVDGFRCTYRPNTNLFYQNSATDPGQVTFTSVSATSLSGSFYAVCRSQTDSVIITGSFNGKPYY